MYTDIKYVYELRPRLEMFKVKSNNPFTVNVRCPVCGDSKKSKTKARGYFYSRKGGIFFKCHNCQYGSHISKLIEILDPDLYRKYRMEKYTTLPKSNTVSVFTTEDMKPKFSRRQPTRLIGSLFDSIDTLPENHIAVKFLVGRNIPRDRWDELYYIENIKDIGNLSKGYCKKITSDEPRIIIPFYNRQNKLIAVDCRALDDHHIRYLTVTINKDESPIYNLNKIDYNQRVFVLEGPFDSMFLPNAIAVGTSDLKKVRKFVDKTNSTFILDNQPRNKEIVKITRKLILNDFEVFIWPEIPEKDINELVTSQKLASDELLQLINRHTFSGMAGYAAFVRWKKV